MSIEIGATLKKLRMDAGLSVKEISDILISKGFKAGESTIYSWENNNSQPTPGALLTMCKAYNVDDVLSAFGFDGYNPDGTIALTIDEIEMVTKYRTLDEHGTEVVDTVLEAEHKRCSEREECLIPMPIEELRKLPLEQRLKLEPYIDCGMLKVARKRKK